jgi:ZIP family zinc transporter
VEIGLLALAGSATALATGAGAVPVFFLGEHAGRLRPFLWGTTVGLMAVASIVGLLLPAIAEDGRASVAAGTCVGAAFLLVSRRLLAGRDVHVGKLRGAGVRRSLLVFGVLLVHSLPEGFAIGTAYASDTEGLALFVIVAIGLQNVPEGTSVAIPMASAGFGRAQQFWAAVLTSAPQPAGAVIAYLRSSRSRRCYRSRLPSRPGRCWRSCSSSSCRKRHWPADGSRRSRVRPWARH